MKSFWCNSNDRCRFAVHPNFFADYAAIPAKPHLPVRVCEHEIRRIAAAFPFARKEQPSEDRLKPQGRKIVSGNAAHRDLVGAAVDAEPDRVRRICEQIRECIRALLAKIA